MRKNIRLNSMNICDVSYSVTHKEQLSELLLHPCELRNAVMGYNMMSLILRLLYQGNITLLARATKEMPLDLTYIYFSVLAAFLKFSVLK